MNYSTIKYFDIANGPGVRVSLFVSGCRHHCKNCFNQIAWAFNSGLEFNKEVEDKIIEVLNHDYIKGISFLGGEPFEPENQEAVLNFIKRIRNILPNKDIWAWSGFTFEEILGKSRAHTKYSLELLNNIDVLVDGRFVEELKDISLQFRGSKNQRIIDLKKTLATNEIVLFDLD